MVGVASSLTDVAQAIQLAIALVVGLAFFRREVPLAATSIRISGESLHDRT
ncbi:MAG: hypothetical protein H7A18_00825 [Sinobacteraceae bacterium]|nr:hypothetical protein [Nevskiaceae bacterium]MCP5470609.1 hypothetical protein [Nevskiaceae bacterium]